MGWLYTQGQTRSELIKKLTEPWTNEKSGVTTTAIAKFASGNSLWVVFEQTGETAPEPKRFIGLFLLAPHKGYGWGYKDMDESMGPCEVSCPPKFLDMVPDPGGYATGWRVKVREYHARRNQKLVVGQEVKLINGHSYKVTNLKPLRGVGVSDGVMYRIPRRMLTLQESAQPKSEQAAEAASEVA